MCIKVYANGRASGAGTHVTVSVHLMRGEHDSRLVWPFRGDITIQLVNHSNDQDQFEETVDFSDAAAASSAVSHRVTASGENRAKFGWGIYQFISHIIVEFTTETSRYVVNDCLTFRITNVVVHSI